MKRNLQKTFYGRNSSRLISLFSIFALSFGLFCVQVQQLSAAPSQVKQSPTTHCTEHNRMNCNSCVNGVAGADMYYELVPHVVLPETIQYNRVAPKSSLSPVAGSASPFVATYTAFPSYNLPADTEMRQINQLVYPVAPKTLPMPLPQKNTKKDNAKKDNAKNNTNYRNEKRSVETQFEPDKDKIELKNDPADLKQDQDIDNLQKQPSNQILSKKISNKKSSLSAKNNKTNNAKTNNKYDSATANKMFDISMTILQVSANEEIIPATPRFAINDDVMQAGIFCNSAAPKQPSAWSFSSPIFKIASVPAGFGAGNGYISQFNSHGGVNVGFQPPIGAGQVPPQAGAYPYPPAPPAYAQNNGANVQVLPNGMLLLSTPPNHHNCGLLRCHYDHSRRFILLPPPNQFQQLPGIMPPPQQILPPQTTPTTTNAIDPQTQALMLQYPQFNNPYANINPYQQQPQLAPVTAMTPYGMTIVGYRQIPQIPQNYATLGTPTGNFMNVAYGQTGQIQPAQIQLAQQQLLQQQLAQQQLVQQQLAQQKSAQQQLAQQKLNAAQNDDADTQDTNNKDNAGETAELKTPLPINGVVNDAKLENAIQNSGQAGIYANPYAMYALQSGNLTTGNNAAADAAAGISNEQSIGITTAQTNPQFNILPNPYSNYPMPITSQQAGMYQPYAFSPYGAPVYPAAQFAGQYGNQFMSPYGQPFIPGYMPVGLQQNIPQQQTNQNNGNGLTMSDMLLLMVLMKENNKPQRRLSFFERIAERRAARRQRAEQNDPFNQIMQMWSTPYYADSTARMPASNAYPYGYFGAQPTPINTANYGGYHNLYYGNTTYY
ncbi:MAG: hypothetical protein LBP59_06615 [Planctomycetaceae bacterium]|jgi:hypothetical protein|nr:hypothetical protein [Planctomycetaceae bacterium]